MYLMNSDMPISKVRGQIFEFKGKKVIPTFHPSYLLRNRSEKEGSPLFYAKLDMQAIGYMYKQLKANPNLDLKKLVETTEKGIVAAENRVKK